MTTMTISDGVLSRIRQSRNDAALLLETLVAERAASERRLAEMRRSDMLKQVTGRSALDGAIESTRRMIETLDRRLAEVERPACHVGPFAMSGGAAMAGRGGR